MNRSRLASPFAAIAAAAALCAGCGQTPPTSATLTPSSPSGADANAGNWQMIVLSGPTQFEVAPPAPASSEAYRAEIATIKTAQANLTAEQKEVIEYWSGGGVLRWNEIMLEMVAKADIPPAPRPDGTYPAPDQENPFADPQFPFSNPPYAARAMSYVSVAQFEALKVAWHYKFLYGRPSPASVDSGIQSLMPATNVPAYPSEDAVLSGVTAELLKLLFPTSVEEITRRAADQRNAALWSGRAAPSDIAAGLALGKAVAPVFAARAATDGMRTAGGSPAVWAAMANAATARGETPWKSLESPPRPPMLPLFGQVRAWMMTPTDIVAERPGPPPSTSSAQMQQETAEVKSTLDNLTREQLAIAYIWSDGASTYTPPGHWNAIAQSYVNGARWSEVRAARAYALLNMALHDAAVGCWDTKYAYFNPRPSQLDPRIRTVVGLPNFPSYTSGHSTFSAASAAVLSYLFPSEASYFKSQADEAAISRLYGGIHYRADIEVGVDHGNRIGGYTVRFARQDGAD
ncbi:MAG: phosphatase PAP2 family protein [Vicinamibacteria bacterium]